MQQKLQAALRPLASLHYAQRKAPGSFSRRNSSPSADRPPLPRSVKNSFRSPKGQFPRSSRPKSLKNHFHFESQGSKAVSASSLRRGQEARGHFPPHPSLPSSSPFPPRCVPLQQSPEPRLWEGTRPSPRPGNVWGLYRSLPV